MNVEEIKKRLRQGNQVNLEPPAPEYKHEEESIYIAPKDDKQMSHTEIFSRDSDDDSEIENSEVWRCPNYDEDGMVSASSFVKLNNLDCKKYDWRESTRKGRNSRKNFSNYIITVI
jgi:hypothetical protein